MDESRGAERQFVQESTELLQRVAFEHGLHCFRTVLEGMDVAVIDTDEHEIVLGLNAPARRITGWEENEACGHSVWEIVRTAEHATTSRSMSLRSSVGPNGERMCVVARDGELHRVDIWAIPAVYAPGAPPGRACATVLLREVGSSDAQAARLSRLLDVLRAMNQAIVRLRDPLVLYAEACRIAVEKGGLRMAWVGLVDGESSRLRPVAQAGLVDGYLELVRVSTANDERARGPSGGALHSGQHVVCNDIANDPRMKPWRDEALRRGYRSSAAFPIQSNGVVHGTINLYAGTTQYFDAEELRLLDDLASDLGLVLDFAEAEQARRVLSERVSDLLGGMGDGFVAIDQAWRFRYANRRALEMLGLTTDLIGKSALDVFAGVRNSVSRDACEKAMHQRISVQCETYSPGWDRWFENRIYPTDEGVSVFFVDVTERKRNDVERERADNEVRRLNAELELRVQQRTEQLAAVNRELETFAYTVAHDLRAPLRAIDGYGRLLQEECGKDLHGDGPLFIQNIRRGVGQLAELIDDLLAYSRMERRALQSVVVDVNRLVSGLLAERQDDAESGHVTHVLKLATPLSIRADSDGLAMVLRNLYDNALKFSRDSSPPVVEIGGAVEQDVVRIWVRDNGIGFDMKFHDRIFEIFQRLHRAEVYPGTGVGLAIVRKAMQRMGGRVWATSNVGEGATFYLELPQ